MLLAGLRRRFPASSREDFDVFGIRGREPRRRAIIEAFHPGAHAARRRPAPCVLNDAPGPDVSRAPASRSIGPRDTSRFARGWRSPALPHGYQAGPAAQRRHSRRSRGARGSRGTPPPTRSADSSSAAASRGWARPLVEIGSVRGPRLPRLRARPRGPKARAACSHERGRLGSRRSSRWRAAACGGSWAGNGTCRRRSISSRRRLGATLSRTCSSRCVRSTAGSD